MSDYALVIASPNPNPPQSPLVCFESTFEGFPLRLAIRPGRKEDHVYAEDVERGIGSDMVPHIRSLVYRLRFPGQVREGDGVVRTRLLLTLEDFFTICQLNPSLRMDSFRSRVSGILSEIHHTGRYEDPARSTEIPSAGTPTLSTALRHLADVVDRQDALERHQLEIKRELEAKLGETNSKAEHAIATAEGYTGRFRLAPWAGITAGIELGRQEASDEGKLLTNMALSKGDNPRNYKTQDTNWNWVNTYRVSDLWDWADDYKRRNPHCRYRGRPPASA